MALLNKWSNINLKLSGNDTWYHNGCNTCVYTWLSMDSGLMNNKHVADIDMESWPMVAQGPLAVFLVARKAQAQYPRGPSSKLVQQ